MQGRPVPPSKRPLISATSTVWLLLALAPLAWVGAIGCGQPVNKDAPPNLTYADSSMARALANETCQCTAQAMKPDATTEQVVAAEACIKNVKEKAKNHMYKLRDERIRKMFNEYGQKFVDSCYVQQRTAAGLPPLPDVPAPAQ